MGADDWKQLSDEARAEVFTVLERESLRHAQHAAEMRGVAQNLGRPSLVDSHDRRSDAFRAALVALRRLAED